MRGHQRQRSSMTALGHEQTISPGGYNIPLCVQKRMCPGGVVKSNRQNNFPNVLAGFHAGVGFGCVGEWIRAVDHDLDLT